MRELKRFIIFVSVLLIILPGISWGETNPYVEYFVVFYPSISPDGDGSKDLSPIKLKIADSCNYISLTLEDTLLTTVFDTLFSITEPDTGEYSLYWTGMDSTGYLLPEGRYLLHLHAVGDTSSWNDYREVAIDTTTPMVRIDRIEPGIYLPGVPGREERVIIYYTLSMIGAGDSITAFITRPDQTTEDIVPAETASGTYTVEWAGDQTIPDGYYSVYFRADDEAGNGSSDEAFFEVDNAGPVIAFIDTVAKYANHTPSIIEGTCFDRNGIENLLLSWNNSPEFPPDSTFTIGDTIHWLFDIEDSVTANGNYVEGYYKLGVSCSDSFDHTSSKLMSFYIDTTPPPPPYLQPAPDRVNEEKLTIVGNSNVEEADSVFVYYTNNVDTTFEKKKLFLDVFSATLELFDGFNTVWAVAKDKAGNFSSPSNKIVVEYRIVDETTFPEVFRSPDYFRVYSTEEMLSVEVKIFTINGELVRTIRSEGPAEKFAVYWDLLNEDGNEVNNGPYLVVITTEHKGSARRVNKNLIAVVR